MFSVNTFQDNLDPPTLNCSQCYYLLDIYLIIMAVLLHYIQGDKYVQADVSVEHKDYPHDPKYKRAEVCR